MSTLSRWIIAFAVLLILADVVDILTPQIDLGLNGRSLICGWIGGTVLLASGLAATQRRRVLRIGGLWVAVALMIALASLFTWDAAVSWRGTTATTSTFLPSISLSLLALACITLLGIVNHLRPREGIASRGYAVPIPHLKNSRPVEAQPLQTNNRRSEVG